MDKYGRNQLALFKKNRPCRFCKHPYTMILMDCVDFGYYVLCSSINCGARGPLRDTRRKAANAWNKKKS